MALTYAVNSDEATQQQPAKAQKVLLQQLDYASIHNEGVRLAKGGRHPTRKNSSVQRLTNA